MKSADRLDFRSYRNETERHHHAFWQVVLPVRGRLDMDIDGRAGAVGNRCGALIPAGLDHAFEAGGENRFLVADVESLSLPAPLAERFAARPFFRIPPAVNALVAFSRGMGAKTVLTAPWSMLLLSALEDALPAGRYEKPVARAIALMEARLAEPLSLAALSAAAGLPEHQLHHAFRSIHGVSPYAYLSRLRLERAMRLIEETTLPLGDIAARTGHADQSALTRRMRQHGHLSPAAHRRAHRLEMISPVRNDQDEAGRGC